MEEIGHAMGGSKVWRNALSPGPPGAHHEGGTRMGNDPNTSVANKYGQTWDIPNLFVIGSSTFAPGVAPRRQATAGDVAAQCG
jgi:choline dehydrogenase-like flavoprotein